jgi:aspartyl-tRNA(Asn)/glutamyl-tRNA(Gln) amidotransferase subunit C
LKITKEEVEHVAHLARLDFTEDEKEKFTSQLNDILMYVDTLNRIDTTGVEPMSHAIAIHNAFRDDRVSESLDPDLPLANAPDAKGPFFRVPKVIEA